MYLERKRLESKEDVYKYKYLHECPSCLKPRWTSHTKANRCSTCAGRESYKPHTVKRKDARKRGDGYITKQGYHLIYVDGNYIPAHRLAFKDLPKHKIVHHIDGNKLNNHISNLHPCSKSEHRIIHGQLERLSYKLIQSDNIYFEDGEYKFRASIEKLIDENSVNSGELLTLKGEDNPEPSLVRGRCNDYPTEEYAQVSGSAEDLNK